MIALAASVAVAAEVHVSYEHRLTPARHLVPRARIVPNGRGALGATPSDIELPSLYVSPLGPRWAGVIDVAVPLDDADFSLLFSLGGATEQFAWTLGQGARFTPRVADVFADFGVDVPAPLVRGIEFHLVTGMGANAAALVAEPWPTVVAFSPQLMWGLGLTFRVGPLRLRTEVRARSVWGGQVATGTAELPDAQLQWTFRSSEARIGLLVGIGFGPRAGE